MRATACCAAAVLAVGPAACATAENPDEETAKVAPTPTPTSEAPENVEDEGGPETAEETEDVEEADEPEEPEEPEEAERAEVTTAPADASPFLTGPAAPELPAGEAGEVAVAATGGYHERRGVLPFIARNMTDEAVLRVEVSGTARGADGDIAATGRSQEVTPNLVEPGEIVFGYVFFGLDVDVDEGADFDLTVDYQTDDDFENIRDLEVADAGLAEGGLSGMQVVGEVANPYDHEVDGPISVTVACFDGDALTEVTSGFADRDQVRADETVSFSVRAGESCSTFLVGARGFYQDF